MIFSIGVKGLNLVRSSGEPHLQGINISTSKNKIIESRFFDAEKGHNLHKDEPIIFHNRRLTS